MKRAQETLCCWLERGTRIIRLWRAGRSNLTIARWRGAPFANAASKAHGTAKGKASRGMAQGLAPSALVMRCDEGARASGQRCKPLTDLSKGGALKTRKKNEPWGTG